MAASIGPTTGREHLSTARSRESVLGCDRIQSGNVVVLSKLDSTHSRFIGQGIEQERRRLGGHLLRPEGARKSGVELDLHPDGEKLVPVVPLLRT